MGMGFKFSYQSTHAMVKDTIRIGSVTMKSRDVCELLNAPWQIPTQVQTRHHNVDLHQSSYAMIQ